MVTLVPTSCHYAFLCPCWHIVFPKWNKADCSHNVGIICAYSTDTHRGRLMHARVFFHRVFFHCRSSSLLHDPPPTKPSMIPGSYSFEPAKPQAAMSFTDMLNASDEFATSTPGDLHSRHFESDSLDDTLFSPAQISQSGTTPTTISSLQDTGTTSTAYLHLVRQFTDSQLELRLLK